jgi:glutamine synthetase
MQGLLTLEQLELAVQRQEIDTVICALPDMYGRLVGKRMAAPFFLESVARGGMHVCDYLLACDMEMDPVPGYALTSWETGYGDFHWTPDLATLRRADWLQRTALLLGDLDHPDHRPVEEAPRQVLKRQVQRAAAMGYRVYGAAEIEMYCLDETFDAARSRRYADLRMAGSYIEDYHLLQGTRVEPLIGAIRRALESAGLPVECSKGEWGPGQHEINLKYAEAVETCDRAALFKHICKEVALQQGKAVTFMAKLDENLAGNGQHLHLSLRSLEGDRPVFEGSAHTRTFNVPFRHFLGGMLAHSREWSAFLAPNPNSYKRFQVGSFAPTAIAWSVDNRTSGFRVVGEGSSLRVECRIAGADANAYLALAGLLAAGLDGLEKAIEPGEPISGDLYAVEGLPRVPSSLPEAARIFAESPHVAAALGSGVQSHYAHFLATEQRKFAAAVTDWERMRYFERI